MARKHLPTYSICSLTEKPASANEFMADHFAHYLDVHQDLHFPHKHTFYHLVYFSKGSGRHSIDFVHFPVQPGQVYFMVPGQVHSWDFDEKPDGYIVNFSDNFLSSWLSASRYPEQFRFFSGMAAGQVIDIPEAFRPHLQQILELVIEEYHAEKDQAEDMIRSLLIQFFISVDRCTHPKDDRPANNYNSLLLKNFQKLIDLHYKEKKLTRDYASLLYVTPNHLNALSKDMTGRSAGELIRDRVLLEVKRLLVNADMTIAEIAAELNFEDNSYFSKYFKKYTGVTPEIFRKQQLKN